MSAPYLLNPFKDYFETWVQYLPGQDDVQKSYFNNVRQRSRSNSEVEVQKITFHVAPHLEKTVED